MSQGLDPRRAVQVVSNRAGELRFGSGYQVSADLVLTAEHVVTGAQTLVIRFVDGPRRVRESAAYVVWRHVSVDLAVVRLEIPTAGLEQVEFARLDGRTAICEAVGYPWFKLRENQVAFDDANPGVYRESHHARGVVSAHSNRRSETLELSVAAPLPHSDPKRSAWEGMSGAAVFADGYVVGVVSENFGREGPGWLTARSVASWFPDPLDEQFETLHALLGLAKTGSLPKVKGSDSAGRGISPRQLPADTAFFTGRENELEQLLGLASRTNSGASPGTVVISALNGMGGVGKTALAVHAGHLLAEEFPDGQLFPAWHDGRGNRAVQDGRAGCPSDSRPDPDPQTTGARRITGVVALGGGMRDCGVDCRCSR